MGRQSLPAVAGGTRQTDQAIYQPATAGRIDRYPGPTQIREEDSRLNAHHRSVSRSLFGARRRGTPATPLAPDPDDDVVIATAIAAKADWVVTGDHPLLTVAEYQNVRIIDVNEALRRIAAKEM
ncbi:MAG: PIN domain-containing protein [Gammaproteobacteria bacterium]|nr:PIN domain-containing protein [Gammaproteobacteria bacterium]